MMEALRSSETSVLTIATLRNISEDAILHSHRRENLKSCYSSAALLYYVHYIGAIEGVHKVYLALGASFTLTYQHFIITVNSMFLS
jgi:hypothetical protein